MADDGWNQGIRQENDSGRRIKSIGYKRANRDIRFQPVLSVVADNNRRLRDYPFYPKLLYTPNINAYGTITLFYWNIIYSLLAAPHPFIAASPSSYNSRIRTAHWRYAAHVGCRLFVWCTLHITTRMAGRTAYRLLQLPPERPDGTFPRLDVLLRFMPERAVILCR